MAFTVRAFGYRGVVQGRILIPFQDSKDSMFMLNQPYEWAGNVSTNGTVAVSIAGPTIDLATILRVEVPDGQQIRYEISTTQNQRTAGVNSPLLDGRTQIYWIPNATLSLIDASGT